MICTLWWIWPFFGFFLKTVDFLTKKLGTMPSKSDLSQSEAAGLIAFGISSGTSRLSWKIKSELVAIVVKIVCSWLNKRSTKCLICSHMHCCYQVHVVRCGLCIPTYWLNSGFSVLVPSQLHLFDVGWGSKETFGTSSISSVELFHFKPRIEWSDGWGEKGMLGWR